MADDMNSLTSAQSGKPWVLGVYISGLLGFGLVGLIIAYVKQGEFSNTLWASHFTYAIRTFWLGLLGIVIGFVLTFLLIGVFLIWLVALWAFVRMVVGLIRALSDQPIAAPKTWLL